MRQIKNEGAIPWSSLTAGVALYLFRNYPENTSGGIVAFFQTKL